VPALVASGAAALRPVVDPLFRHPLARYLDEIEGISARERAMCAGLFDCAAAVTRAVLALMFTARLGEICETGLPSVVTARDVVCPQEPG